MSECENHCPQCNKVLISSMCRLVQDTCGHRKCRLCLLQDEDACQQCNEKGNTQQLIKESVIKYENTSANKRAADLSKLQDNTEQFPTENKFIQPKDSEISTAVKSSGYKNTEKTKKRNYKTLIVPPHIHILKNPTSYRCNVCNKTFNTKSHVKYHFYCKEGLKPFRCDDCGKEFIKKSHLEIHSYVHVGTKPYSCSICNKTFALQSKLNRHKLLHGTAKPYICQQCGKSFRSKDSLRIHAYIHSGERPYTCSECGAKFNNSSNLKKHGATHSKEKVHMCDQCGKRFKLKWALTVHKRSHLRLRPHTCINCSKTFVNAKDLRRHELIHIEMKGYNCGICNVGFRRKDNLERHMRNTHPGKTAKPVQNILKSLDLKPTTTHPVDTPNAIKVITASPSLNKMAKTENSTASFVNVPLKLAFKTSAFKNNYNIHRDYIEPPKILPKSYDLAESVNICQKILSPPSPPPRDIIRTLGKVDEKVSNEICQKIFSPYSTPPIHYETSFEHKKHAIIKNIKFKLPPKYTNIKSTDILSEITPLQPVKKVSTNDLDFPSKNGTYTELKTVSNGATSVIVKGNGNQQNDMHWRRRTSQLLGLHGNK